MNATYAAATGWQTSTFNEIVEAMRRQRALGHDGPVLSFERSGVPLQLRFDKPTSMRSMPFRFENQLAYELADIELGARCVVHVSTELDDVYLPRLAGVFALLEELCFIHRLGRPITVSVALGDLELSGTAMAFSANAPDGRLIPDPYFLITRAYAKERDDYALPLRPWDDRIDRAYWRGAPSGMLGGVSAEQLPRVELARLCRSLPDLFDVALVLGADADAAFRARLEQLDVLGNREPQERMLAYRYQIDVDGYSNAWSGLFLKLLSGAPVLKVASRAGYRQWYYGRLMPWVNYVPIQADLSNLVASLARLRTDPDLARNIGRMGRELALELSYESQVRMGAAVLLQGARSANR